MNTKRRFTEIKVKVERFERFFTSKQAKRTKVDNQPKDKEVIAERIAAIVEKFKMHTKKLKVGNFPTSSRDFYSAFLGAASDVEELSLSEFGVEPQDPSEMQKKRTFVLQADFTKLKKLSISCVAEIIAILNKIPDNSLESLTVWRNAELSKASLQKFVNRQTSLKRLDLDAGLYPDLKHLVLDKLAWSLPRRVSQSKAALAKNLKTQLALRYLQCAYIDKANFELLRKLPQLEVLHADVSEDASVTGALESLKVLWIHTSDCSIMRQVSLPKLEKLILCRTCYNHSLKSEDFVALSRKPQNLQHIEINYVKIDFLGTIIEHFPALKTLLINSDYARNEADFSGPPPRHQNLSLEELIVGKYSPTPTGSLHEAIIACPKLKRIMLKGVEFTEQQIVVLMRNLPELTHFWFSSHYFFESDEDDEDGEARVWGPVPMGMIDVFKSSPRFVNLTVHLVADWGEQRLVDDNDRITVTKLSGPCIDQIGLKMVKKSAVPDPFKNFHDRQMGDGLKDYKFQN